MASPAGSTTRPAAVVLVGGASSRMGADKASLVVDGTTMLDHVLGVLEQCGVDRVAVAGTAQVPDAPGESSEGRAGPLAGVIGGWRHLRSSEKGAFDPIVVLACDLPGLDVMVVQRLVDEALTAPHGAVAHDGERPQPLIAAYRPATLAVMERAFDQGERSVRRCFPGLQLATVAFEQAQLADADEPADLQGFDVEWPD